MIDKTMKLTRSMIKGISLHGVDDFAYISMKIGRDLMQLWLLTVAMQGFRMLLNAKFLGV